MLPDVAVTGTVSRARSQSQGKRLTFGLHGRRILGGTPPPLAVEIILV